MMTRRAAVLIAVLITIGTSGCFGSPTSTQATSAPTPSPSPLFASDEEALAAVTKAYAAYLAAGDVAGQGGWKDVSGLKPLTTQSAFEIDAETARKYRDAGYASAGTTTFDSVTVQKFNNSGATAYLCLDATAVDVFDATGASVVQRDQPRRAPLSISFEVAPDRLSLLVGGSEIWTGKNFC